ncbi:MAG TPA: hypothetical protein VEG68_16030 [Terriglobales bacterium]|nr:hypothetical protein [Terriglobales bacterium]
MKFCKFGLFLALLVAVCLPAAAQTQLHVNIPFNFVVDGKALPAGQYTVRQVFPNDDMVWGLFGDHHSAMVVTGTLQSVSASHELSLIFLHQGEQYSLTRIWTSEHLSRDVPRSNVKQTVIAKGDSNYVGVRAE